MLDMETQQQVREVLRKVDQMLVATIEAEEALQRRAGQFRDDMFNAFQLIEQETLALQELQIQPKRTERNQMIIQQRGRAGFVLLLDPEISYDTKQTEQAADANMEISVRMFAVLAAPNRGLLRYYTIFADGTWKRTTFALSSGTHVARHALVSRSTPDVLIREAIDLVGHVCTLHPTWSAMTDQVETLTVETFRDRTQIKTYLTGLGATRR